jgi:hypothetical protein
LWIARLERAPPLNRQLVEAVKIELPGGNVEHVAAPAGDQQPIAERLSQARDEHLDRLRGGGWRALAPQLIDQAIARNKLTPVEHQHSQQRPLLRTADPHRSVGLDHLERPQNSKRDHAPDPRPRP